MSKQRILIIGFDREDEALIDIPNGEGWTRLPLSGSAGLTFDLFAASNTKPQFDSCGQSLSGRSFWFRLEKESFRPKAIEAIQDTKKASVSKRKKNPSHPSDTVVPMLRLSDLQGANQVNASGELDSEQLEKFQTHATRKLNRKQVERLIWILGILHGPNWNEDSLVEACGNIISKAGIPSNNILITSVGAFRDAGHRVREHGSTSAAVEDLCRIVTNNCYQDFFKLFSSIMVRLRSDAIVHFEISSDNRKGYGLHLMSVGTTDDLPTVGELLVIVALVNGGVHIRIFDADGQKVVDKPEGDFDSGPNLTYLKKLLNENPFPDASELSQNEKKEIIEKATLVSGQWKCKLYYILEGDRSKWFQYGSRTFGLDSLFANSIAQSVIGNEKKSICAGLRRVWNALKHGYGQKEAFTRRSTVKTFPWKAILKEWQSSLRGIRVESCEIPNDDIRLPNRFSLFQQAIGWNPSTASENELTNLAMQIVRDGAESTGKNNIKGKRFRVFKLGKIVSIDREEIDGLTSLQRLINFYLKASVADRPLNIAVFGAPGAGKSFGVKQIAASLSQQDLKVWKTPLEFNVSQFNSLEDLSEALHVSRDKCLESKKGEIPVVIFDEFDAERDGKAFGWLQYFLMPMQDGKFKAGSHIYHTGNTIFIFAGGINHSFAEFASRQRDRDFCAAKGPDFISRLRGIHNVPPLNKPANVPSMDFPSWKFRRAVLLHEFLKKNNVSIIDKGLLSTLLEFPVYYHGARSLESIIGMSASSPGHVIDRTSLPKREQLDLHVDAQQFWKMLRNKESQPNG